MLAAKCRYTLALAAVLVWLPQAGWPGWHPLPRVRNVILLIPDGCSDGLVTLARWTRNAPLSLDPFRAGAVRTYSANYLIADSAASATAYATGVKTLNGAIAVAPPPDAMFRPQELKWGAYQPLATVLEAARRGGRSVGLVATCHVAEATPAAFASHGVARNRRDDLMAQLAHQNLDVVFGGGAADLAPADGRNLLAVLQRRGYAWVDTAEKLAQLRSGRVWGLFAAEHLSPAMDRALLAPSEPTLAEMTRQAIQLLNRDPDGFFLMVEGSQVDWACHLNDPAMAVTEFLAFDDAAGVALAFAAADRHTLVLACPDHDTGGLVIGSRKHPKPASADALTAPLHKLSLSAAGIERKLKESRSPADMTAQVEELMDAGLSFEEATAEVERRWPLRITGAGVAAQVAAWWDIRLSQAEAAAVTNAIACGQRPAAALNEIVLGRRLPISWATTDHTGTDVPFWSYGPGRPTGVLDNTDIAGAIARALDLDLQTATAELFVPATALIADARVDASDASNPVLRLGRGMAPINTDVLILDGREHPLGGVVVNIDATGTTYLPRLPKALLQSCGKNP